MSGRTHLTVLSTQSARVTTGLLAPFQNHTRIMHLTHIQATGTERPFSHKLDPLTAIVGPNRTGKTTCLNAIQALLLGNVPALGKTNGSTFQIAMGKQLRILGEFSEGSGAIRTWTATKTGASLESQVPEFLAKPMVMLDPLTYFGMTETEQVRYIFANMTVPASCTVDSLFSELSAIKRSDDIDLNAITKEMKAAGISDGLVKLTGPKGYVTTRYADLNKRVKDTIGAVRTLTELKNRGGECSAESLAQLKSKLTEAQEQVNRCNQIGGELNAQARQAETTRQRREHLQSVLAFPALTESELLKCVEEQIKDLESNWDKSKDEVNLGKLRAEYNEAMLEWKTDQKQIQSLKDQAQEVNGNLEELRAAKCCPHCKSSDGKWKTHLQKTLNTQASHIKRAIELLEPQAIKSEKIAKELETKGREVKAAQDASGKIFDRLRDLYAEGKAIKDRVARNAEQRQQFTAELATLAAVAAPTDKQMDEACEALNNAVSEHHAIQQRHTAAIQLQQQLITAEAAYEEHQKAASQFETIKAYKAVLEEKQKTLIADLFCGLLADANYFTAGIMEPLAFNDGKIGYWSGHNFVSHATFSDTEQHLAYMAVTCALAKDAPLRIALLDKLDVDRDNFPLIMQRLVEAVECGKLDQVVMAVTEAPAVEGWTVIELKKEVA